MTGDHMKVQERQGEKYEASLKILQRAATDGILEAQLVMAKLYSKDANMMQSWLKAAAKTILLFQDCAWFDNVSFLFAEECFQRMFHGALMIGLEEIVVKDKVKALKLLEEARKYGDEKTIMNELIQKGEQASRNKKWQEAKNFISLAYKGNDEGAARELNGLFGEFVRVNIVWKEESAHENNGCMNLVARNATEKHKSDA